MEPSITDQLGYTAKDKKYIRTLLGDDDSRFLLHQAIGNKLACSNRIINGQSLNQLCLLTSQAQFADSEEETVAIAVILMYCMKVSDVLPSLQDHRGKAFAARCLVALGLFRQAMERRWQRHGAPSPDYYRSVGRLYFKQEQMDDIASHFIAWENFLSEHFI